jgi:hypothetical protein
MYKFWHSGETTGDILRHCRKSQKMVISAISRNLIDVIESFGDKQSPDFILT